MSVSVILDLPTPSVISTCAPWKSIIENISLRAGTSIFFKMKSGIITINLPTCLFPNWTKKVKLYSSIS